MTDKKINDLIRQKRGMVWEFYFLKVCQILRTIFIHHQNSNSFKRLKIAKKWYFFVCITPIQRPFYKIMVSYLLDLASHKQPKV